MNTNPNTQEVIEKLKSVTPSIVERMFHGNAIDEAIELIELLQRELAESQRQQRAAVRCINKICARTMPGGLHGGYLYGATTGIGFDVYKLVQDWQEAERPQKG